MNELKQISDQVAKITCSTPEQKKSLQDAADTIIKKNLFKQY